MIKLVNVTKIYDRKTLRANVALDGINLEIKEKGIVTIFGPSGCGKTTLLNLITGIDKPTSGSVTIDDKEVDDDYRLNNIGLVFQDFVLVDELTVMDNIRLVDKSITVKEIDETLNSLGILPLKERKAGRLSGGEKQRVSIARAIIKKPRFIVCDEPTGNLDEKNRVLIMNILKSLSKHYLILLVSHDKALTDEYSDRIIYLEDGKLVKDVAKKETVLEEKHESRGIEYHPTYNRFFKAKTNFIVVFLMAIVTVFTCLVSSMAVGKPKELNHSSENLFEASRILSEEEFEKTASATSITGSHVKSSDSVSFLFNSESPFGNDYCFDVTAQIGELPISHITAMKYGSKNPKSSEVVISSGLADELLKNALRGRAIRLSRYGIDEEEDLIGLTLSSKRIVGISDESSFAYYLDDADFFNLEADYGSSSAMRVNPLVSSYCGGNYMSVSKYNDLYGADLPNDSRIFVRSASSTVDENGVSQSFQLLSIPLGSTTFSRIYHYEVKDLDGGISVLLPDYLFYAVFAETNFYAPDPVAAAALIARENLPMSSFYEITDRTNEQTIGYGIILFGSILLVLALMAAFFLSVDLSSYFASNGNEMMVLRSLGVNKKALIKANFVSVMRAVLISSLIGLAGGTVLSLYLQKFSLALEAFILVHPLTIAISFLVGLAAIALLVLAYLAKKFAGTAAAFKRVNKE